MKRPSLLASWPLGLMTYLTLFGCGPREPELSISQYKVTYHMTNGSVISQYFTPEEFTSGGPTAAKAQIEDVWQTTVAEMVEETIWTEVQR